MAGALYRWLVRRVGARRLLMLALLLTALTSVALGLSEATRGLGLGWLLVVASIGTSSGWWLGGRHGSVALLTASVLGVTITVGWIGRLDRSLVTLLSQPWRVPWPEHPLHEFWQEVATLAGRVGEWVRALMTGTPAYEPVAVALVWSLALWGVAAWAGWAGRRERPLQAILPATMLLLPMLYYTDGDLYPLLPLLATTFLLLVLAGHAIRERAWEARGVDYSRELRADHFFAALALSILLTFLAALAPSVSVAGIVRAISGLTERAPVTVEVRPLADSLGLDRPPPLFSEFEAVRSPGLPRDHLIGAGPELGDQVVMTIQPQGSVEAARPHRWRSATYDRYTGRGWATSEARVQLYEADEATAELSPAGEGIQRFLIETNYAGASPLFAPGELLSSDQPYRVAWRAGPDYFSGYTDATAYEVTSVLPTLSAEALRSAGTAYPRWVARRYLAVPESVPERVLARARELTATEATPYDRARAIETYLRGFPYTLDLPALPPNRDLVDYFLYDLQQGYCDYYATAMVVLARAAGLPARLAVGYARGRYDEDAGQYIVTEAEGHSWPELYFPGFGWVPFEPTAARPPTDLPEEGPVITPAESRTAAFGDRLAEALEGVPWDRLLLGSVLLALLLIIGANLWDRWWLRHLPPSDALARIYARFRRLGQRIGGVMQGGQTPYEFSETVTQRAQQLGERWASVQPQSALRRVSPDDISHDAQRLSALYVGSAYAPLPLTAAQRDEAARLWRSLRWRLVVLWLLAKVRGR